MAHHALSLNGTPSWWTCARTQVLSSLKAVWQTLSTMPHTVGCCLRSLAHSPNASDGQEYTESTPSTETSTRQAVLVACMCMLPGAGWLICMGYSSAQVQCLVGLMEPACRMGWTTSRRHLMGNAEITRMGLGNVWAFRGMGGINSLKIDRPQVECGKGLNDCPHKLSTHGVMALQPKHLFTLVPRVQREKRTRGGYSEVCRFDRMRICTGSVQKLPLQGPSP